MKKLFSIILGVMFMCGAAHATPPKLETGVTPNIIGVDPEEVKELKEYEIDARLKQIGSDAFYARKLQEEEQLQKSQPGGQTYSQPSYVLFFSSNNNNVERFYLNGRPNVAEEEWDAPANERPSCCFGSSSCSIF